MASEDKATEGQIKRLYAVLHSVGLDPTQWKKDQNIASYAKLTRAQCSGYIDEVEALEAEQKHTGSIHPGLPQKPDEKSQFGARADAEARRISEEQGRAITPAAQPAQPPLEGEYTDMRQEIRIEELIKKYVGILERVTAAVEKAEGIPDREKGYATKFIYYSVKHALENGKGGDHEEQV